MQTENSAWYCARTKPKHEHIACANLRKNLELEVFLPRLRIERVTQRGVTRVVEPLFPCYIFVRCVIEEKMAEIKHVNGISSLIRFGNRISKVEDSIIEELQECFAADDLLTVENRLSPGDEVSVAGGAFAGMRAFVLRNMPARKRVQILLDILGRPTPVEVDRDLVILARNSLAELAPALAAPSMAQIRS
jgi:transcriptional antiterminator RfaH